MEHDVLVIGGGIAGMESALNLGDMGFKVLLVEKEASIGGKMILLSKVFPTLDCSSCISTPKMADVAHHPNIDMRVYSEVDGITRNADGTFTASVRRKSTRVDQAACTGCGDCEKVCPVTVPDEFNENLIARRAAHIPFPQAIPKKAVIDCIGQSPCRFTCPAGVKAHGYVALVRAGKYDEAFELHMQDAPIPGSLSRACYAPCEEECMRGEAEGPVAIRGIKRFMVDTYYAKHPVPPYGPPEKLNDKKVAIVGAGPAGLTAAYQLARKGYRVKIFEAAPEAGGMLKLAIPAYRLPNDLVDRDILNITALGVEIETNHEVRKIAPLRKQGYDAVYIATGAVEARSMGVEGEDLEGVMDCMEFLKLVNITHPRPDLSGKTVMVVGGGNSAMDPARSAIRMGAKKVIIQYRRGREEMPAHDWEIEAAEQEGVELQLLHTPVRFHGEGYKLSGVDSIRMELGEPDESGRRRPVPVDGSEKLIPVDIVVLAIGLKPSTTPYVDELETNRNGTLKVNQKTLQSSTPEIFAGGDVVNGPTMISEAIGQGNRAAFYLDHFLQGVSLDEEAFDIPLPPADKEQVRKRMVSITARPEVLAQGLTAEEGRKTFDEIESTFDEEEARAASNRCLDCGTCSECNECVKVCPADAIDLHMLGSEEKVSVDSVILATGFELSPGTAKPLYHYSQLPNVVTAMEMDRLLSPTRPYSAVLRPGDGTSPENIAFVLCAGSRDCQVGNRLCSQVCCMYSIKQAQLLMGALPLAEVTIYYIDIRAFGKGYEEFYEQSKAMGIEYIKGKVSRVNPAANGNLSVMYEDILGGTGLKEVEHDMVVLSVGLLPGEAPATFFEDGLLELDEYNYIRETQEYLDPARTTIAGVYVAGTAAGARDIPDSILHAGAAATHAAVHSMKVKRKVQTP